MPTPDGGVIAHVLSYKAPGSGPVARLVKLDKAGAIVWDWVGRGQGNKDTPNATTLQLTKDVIRMTGHIYLDKVDIEHAWTGEVDAATGKLLSDEVGAANPYKRKAK